MITEDWEEGEPVGLTGFLPIVQRRRGLQSGQQGGGSERVWKWARSGSLERGALTLLSPPSETGVNSSHLHRQLLRVRTVVPDPSSHRGPGTQEGRSCRVLAQCWPSLPAVRPDGVRRPAHVGTHSPKEELTSSRLGSESGQVCACLGLK